MIAIADQAVECNVHYSRYRWQDGYCDGGECVGGSLQAVPLEVADGMVRFAIQSWG